MNLRIHTPIVSLTFCLWLGAAASALAQGTAFTYQGRLNTNGVAAGGTYDLRFSLFDLSTAGTQQGAFLTNAATVVSNGLFTVPLDFGNQFPGGNRWLQVDVRTNGGGTFTPLLPRQQLTPAPYSITASNLTGTLASTQLTGTVPLAQLPTAVVTNNSTNLVLSGSFTGSFSGNGTNLTNVNALTLGGLSSAAFWRTNGNAGANSTNGAFLGTTDNQPLEVKVNNIRVLRLENSGISPNVIEGYSGNVVTNGIIGATIGGGGNSVFPHRIGGNYATIAGGAGNSATGSSSTAGGFGNTASALAATAFGYQNTASGAYSFTTGQTNMASGSNSVAMGYNSSATNDDSFAMGLNTLSLGAGSVAMGGGSRAISDYSIAVGFNNNANGLYDVAMGVGNNANGIGSTAFGNANRATADSSFAVGFQNLASGAYSFASGNTSRAIGGASIAMGSNSLASGDFSIALGNSAIATNLESIAIGFNTLSTGLGATAMGFGSKNSGDFSVAIGGNDAATATGAIAIGTGNNAYGVTATAIGNVNRAGGDNAVSMGAQNLSAGTNSVTLGNQCRAYGSASIAMGTNSVANGDYSIALGNNCTANGTDSFAAGYSVQTTNFESVALGWQTISGGVASLAAGDGSKATGDFSFAMGFSAVALGTCAMSLGNGSHANADYAVALGSGANALHQGTFVWADSQLPNFTSTGNNQFLIRAQGGVGIGTVSPVDSCLTINTNTYETDHVIYFRGATGSDHNHGLAYCGTGATNFATNVIPDGPVLWGFTGGVLGVMNGGAHAVLSWTNGGVFVNGGFAYLSDRNLKSNFNTLDSQSVLDRVAKLPMTSWVYTNSPANRHIGPMAQDFHAAFELDGTDDTRINLGDETGVALAAIQGLNEKLEQKQSEISELKSQNKSLEERLEKLEKMMLAKGN